MELRGAVSGAATLLVFAALALLSCSAGDGAGGQAYPATDTILDFFDAHARGDETTGSSASRVDDTCCTGREITPTVPADG